MPKIAYTSGLTERHSKVYDLAVALLMGLSLTPLLTWISYGISS